MGRMPAGYITAELPTTAQRILVAAQHVLARDGYPGLTLRRIAEEAGEHKSLVIYHFDSKAGLLAALVDSLWHDIDVELFQRLEQLPAESSARAEALTDAHHRLALLGDQYRMYFELLPPCARDRSIRERLAQLNGLYRQLGVDCLGATGFPRPDLEPLASLLLGLGDGMAVLLQLAPDQVDDGAAYGLLKHLLVNTDAAAPRPGGGGRRAVLSAPAAEAFTAGTTADLAPVARNLVRGAVRVLRRRGFQALTMEAVAAAAGEPRSAITYYFGDKRGLVAAVLDCLLADGHRYCERRFAALSSSPDGVHELFTLLGDLIADRPRYRSFFELLPQILRDPEMHAAQAAYDRWLLGALAEGIAAARPDLEPWRDELAILLLASMDGLVLQWMLAPAEFDPAPSLRVLEVLVARLSSAA
jgi:AcrR family transcriptional regulator